MNSKLRLLLLTAAALLGTIPAPGPARAATETIQTSPDRFQFEVGPNGELFGSGEVEYSISRSDPPQGLFQSCNKVWRINAYVDGHSVAQHNMHPPLCSFTRQKLRGEVFPAAEVVAACRNKPGQKVSLRKNTRLVMFNTYYEVSLGQGYEVYQVANKTVPVTAEVTCLPRIDLSLKALQPDGKSVCYGGESTLYATFQPSQQSNNSYMLPRQIDFRLEVVDKNNQVKRYDISHTMPSVWPTTPLQTRFDKVEVPIAGPTTFRVTVDPGQKILETDEENNRFTVSTNVQTACAGSGGTGIVRGPQVEVERESPVKIDRRLPTWNRFPRQPSGLPGDGKRP